MLKAMRPVQKDAIEYLGGKRPELRDDVLVQYALLDSVANVLCPACKLWNTGHGAHMMREAVSLMGGYGITEDCPGFLATSGWTRSSKPPTKAPRPCSAASSASP